MMVRHCSFYCHEHWKCPCHSTSFSSLPFWFLSNTLNISLSSASCSFVILGLADSTGFTCKVAVASLPVKGEPSAHLCCRKLLKQHNKAFSLCLLAGQQRKPLCHRAQQTLCDCLWVAGAGCIQCAATRLW
jgi:hypothetical protein